MLWTIDDLPLSLQYKPQALQQEGLLAANTALSKGLTQHEATFACLQRVKSQEGRSKPSAGVPAVVPEHIQQLLKQTLQSEDTRVKINRAFLGKGALPDDERTLVQADFNAKNELVLTFNTGERLVTRPIEIKEMIEQHISVHTTPFFDWIQFNTEAVVPDEDFLPGMLRWNAFEGTLDLRMGDNATLQLGMEMYCPPVLNNTGLVVPEGSVVYAIGGDVSTSRITFDLALATQSFDSFKVLGVTTEEIQPNDVAFITNFGLVRDINTTGATYGEMWNSGDILYLSPVVPGRLTNIKPVPPFTSIPIAFVGIVDSTVGTIFVKPNPVSRLDYGSFYDSTAQAHTQTETPLPIRFNTTKENFGINVLDLSKLTISRTGLYEFTFTLQLSKSNSNAQNVWIWARVNGVDIPASSNKLSVQGSGTLLVPSWSFQQAMAADDYFQLMWAVDSTTITLVAPAPTAFCPSTPSANMTVVQVNIS